MMGGGGGDSDASVYSYGVFVQHKKSEVIIATRIILKNEKLKIYIGKQCQYITVSVMQTTIQPILIQASMSFIRCSNTNICTRLQADFYAVLTPTKCHNIQTYLKYLSVGIFSWIRLFLIIIARSICSNKIFSSSAFVSCRFWS